MRRSLREQPERNGGQLREQPRTSLSGQDGAREHTRQARAQGHPLRKLLQKPGSMRAGIEEGGVPTTSTSTYPRPHPHTHAAPQAVDRLLECGRTVSDKQNLPHLEARNGNW